MDEFQVYYAKWKKPDSSAYIYELVNFYNIAKAKLQGEKNQGLPVLGLGGGGIARKIQNGMFWSDGTI